jgi:hypothetical protein
LEGKGFTVIEGVVGFAVIPDPKHGAVVASLPRPGILFERLTKEAVKVADGPLRLLERMDVDVSFRKTLTRKFECVIALLAACRSWQAGSAATTLFLPAWCC